MAPEKVSSLIVLDLATPLVAARYVANASTRFLVKWYPLLTCPVAFRALGGGVVYVPDAIKAVPPEAQVGIEQLARGHHYRDYADMLVMVLPPQTDLRDAVPGPSGAKEFDGRLALYWLAPDSGEIDVKWSIAESSADPKRAALTINSAVLSSSEPMPRLSLDDREFYDVALSYTSEDRAHAEPIIRELRAAAIHPFFDSDSEALMWGKDLATELGAIYGRRSKYCLVLVSANYAQKMWTNVERKAALGRAVEQRGHEYILPVRLDATNLEGLPPSAVYVPMGKGPAHIAALLAEKLSRV